MKKRRTFIAIDISDAARRVCADHINRIRSKFPHLRVGWERSEKLHITIAFLGDTSEQELVGLTDQLVRLVLYHDAFRLRLAKTGVFPSTSRPRILWVGLEPSESVTEIWRGVSAACESVGRSRDERTFHPHITIGRIREPAKAKDVATEHLASRIEPVAFEVSEVVIYESTLHPSGSTYSVLSRFSL